MTFEVGNNVYVDRKRGYVSHRVQTDIVLGYIVRFPDGTTQFIQRRTNQTRLNGPFMMPVRGEGR